MSSPRVSRWPLFVVWAMIGTGLAVALRAEDAPTTSSRSSRPPSRTPSPPRSSSGGSGVKGLEEKLNEVLDKQQKILERLDEVMAELQIVKIRATVR